jgi:hypothetical protein
MNTVRGFTADTLLEITLKMGDTVLVGIDLNRFSESMNSV